MMQKITFGIIVFILTIVGTSTVSNSPLVSASASGSAACSSLDIINSKQGCGDGTSTPGKTSINSIIKKVVDTLSLVVGIITVFMIILAGFQFVTSGGDSNAVSKARTALFYAMIGLLVIALSQFLTHFVLNTATSEPTSSTTTKAEPATSNGRGN